VLPVSNLKKELIKAKSKPPSLLSTIDKEDQITLALITTSTCRVTCLQNEEAFPSQTPIALIKLISITFNKTTARRNSSYCILKLIPVWACLTLVLVRKAARVRTLNISQVLIVEKAAKFGYLMVTT
jgi:hypothetical protein